MNFRVKIKFRHYFLKTMKRKKKVLRIEESNIVSRILVSIEIIYVFYDISQNSNVIKKEPNVYQSNMKVYYKVSY